MALAILAILVAIVVSSVVAGVVLTAGDWELNVASGLGDEFGRVAGQLTGDLPLDHKRVPLIVNAALTVPLWLCLLGVPWLFSGRKILNLRRDYGATMTKRDIWAGLLIGVATQVVLLPIVYAPLAPFIDADELSAPARNLVASADSTIGVVALVLLTVLGAPIAEEFLYRGLLFRGLKDWFAKWNQVGVVLAILGSAIVFAVSHFQVLQFPGLLVFGIVAGLALQVTGRLGTAVWIHVGFNATTVAVLLQRIT